MSKESGFLREIYSSEDTMKIVEITTKDLEYDINLVDKAAAGFEGIGTSSERSSTTDKILSKTMACCREIIHERRNSSMWQTSLLSYSKKLPHTPTFRNHHPGLSAAINFKATPSTSKKKYHHSLKVQMMVSNF